MNRWTKLSVFLLALVLLAACGTSSSGADAATAAGLDAAATAGTDASTTPGADGGLGPPLDFTITVAATCPFTACGGALLGTWDYTALCISEAEILDPLKVACSTATIVNATGHGKGRVTFTATHVTRDIDWTGTATVNFPAACTLGSCANAQAALRQVSGFETTTCTGAGDCACTAPLTGKIKSIDAYTTTATQVKVVGGHDYAYCITGTTMAYDDVTTPSGELGVATMEKQ
ncbi:MAG TPA: hypothetical protein VGK67_03130 [Myxococcales bacterium]|jgi:hypothetical protein